MSRMVVSIDPPVCSENNNNHHCLFKELYKEDRQPAALKKKQQKTRKEKSLADKIFISPKLLVNVIYNSSFCHPHNRRKCTYQIFPFDLFVFSCFLLVLSNQLIYCVIKKSSVKFNIKSIENTVKHS
jgi:hypothetical protein